MMTWPGQDIENAGDNIKAGARVGVTKLKISVQNMIKKN
jgi:hypothetical protein